MAGKTSLVTQCLNSCASGVLAERTSEYTPLSLMMTILRLMHFMH